MKPPKKLHDYVHFIEIIYGGTMDRNGIVECIAANIVFYKNGFVGRNTFRKVEKHFIDLLHYNIIFVNN